jgi:hypothetical protein
MEAAPVERDHSPEPPEAGSRNTRVPGPYALIINQNGRMETKTPTIATNSA